MSLLSKIFKKLKRQKQNKPTVTVTYEGNYKPKLEIKKILSIEKVDGETKFKVKQANGNIRIVSDKSVFWYIHTDDYTDLYMQLNDMRHAYFNLNNKLWEKGLDYEKNREYQKAIPYYLKSINKYNYYITLHPYQRLVTIYDHMKEFDKEEEICDQAIEKFSKQRPTPFLIFGEIVYDPLTEYDASDEEIRQNNLKYFKDRKQYTWKRRYRDKVMILKEKGKLAESEEDYGNAVKYYRELIEDYQFYQPFPYNRLVIIFRKLKLYEEEVEVCDLAIQNLAYYKHRTGFIRDGEVDFIDDDIAIDPENKQVLKFKNRRVKAEKLMDKNKG